jgi:hypothetical protein
MILAVFCWQTRGFDHVFTVLTSLTGEGEGISDPSEPGRDELREEDFDFTAWLTFQPSDTGFSSWYASKSPNTMISDLQTVEQIVAIAHGKTMGDELGFAFPDVLEAIKLCTVHRIAVLGVEIFLVRGETYETIRMSAYEIEDQEWGA